MAMTDQPTPPSSQPGAATLPQRSPPIRAELPKFKVLLHNDDINDLDFVVDTIMELAAVSQQAAVQIAVEADTHGLAMILVTHKERAELYTEQFASKGLTTTMEPQV